ncbi:MAG: hypothetical protein EBR06_03255, partial [Acidimicrobiia bacterium]|nr:hypothetical protein [Acidimicrobiia bacterium]
MWQNLTYRIYLHGCTTFPPQSRRDPLVASPRITGGDTPDTVRQYLNEIGKYPLLTAADERVLGKAVKDGQRAAERLAN